MFDERTPKRDFALPNVANPLKIDVERLRDTIMHLDDVAYISDLIAESVVYGRDGVEAANVKEALDALFEGLGNIDLNAENVTYDQPSGGPITAKDALDAIIGYMQKISYSFTSTPAFSGVDPRIVVGGNLSYLNIQQKRADLGASDGSVRVRFLSDNDTEVAAIFCEGSTGLLRFYSRDNATGGTTVGMVVGSKSNPNTTIGLPKTAAATETVILNGATVRPNTTNATILGSSSYNWDNIYARTSTIGTSDERLKTDVAPIPDEVLDAWSEVEFVQYRFIDSIDKKGDKARLHTGVIAQRVKEAFERHRLDPFAYGILCYDEWDAVQEEKTDDGEIITPGLEAGNKYSMRYEEALVLEAALMRREMKRMKEALGLS
jgi:Chaperone of endosialidase